MPSITVRHVPESTRDELAARAARQGRSLQEYLLHHLIDLAAKPDPVELASRVSARKSQTGSKLTSRQILSHLAAGRR